MPSLKRKPAETKEAEGLNEIEVIHNRILRELIKPENFSHLEIKDVVNGFRINVVTKRYEAGNSFPIYNRPISWYEAKT